MHQMELADSKTQISVTGEVADDYAALLSSTNSISDAAAIVADALTRKLGKALSMPATDVDINKTLHAYGVDSLVAVELRNWFAKEMKADVAIFDIMNGVSIAAVSQTAAGKSQYKQSEWEENTQNDGL